MKPILVHSDDGDDGGLPVYPIPTQARLDAHYFVQWNIKRWRGSDTRKKAYRDPEVGFYARELFDLAQEETPIGTLPRSDEDLAFMLHIPLERWQTLKRREFSPLHGWFEVLCDDNTVRLAHKVVMEVATERLDSNRRNSAKNADDRMRKRLQTIAQHVVAISGRKEASKSDELLNRISDWIDAHYPGGSATEKRVREAWEALSNRA